MLSILDCVPGDYGSGSPFDKVFPPTLEALQIVIPQVQVIQGVAFMAVPGERGALGSLSGSIPWGQVTSKPTQGTDSHNVTSGGAQSVLLAHSPILGTFEMYINGLRQFDLSDVNLSGNSLVIPVTYLLMPPDKVSFIYLY